MANWYSWIIFGKPLRKVRKRKCGIVLNDMAVRWNYLSPPIGYKLNSKSLMLTVRNTLDPHVLFLLILLSLFFSLRNVVA